MPKIYVELSQDSGLKAVFSCCKDVAKDRNTSDHLAFIYTWLVSHTGYLVHGNSFGEEEEEEADNNSERAVSNMKGRKEDGHYKRGKNPNKA